MTDKTPAAMVLALCRAAQDLKDAGPDTDWALLPAWLHDGLCEAIDVLISVERAASALPCADCRVDTSSGGIGEYYMVHADVWRAGGLDSGFLCIGCLEGRLARALTAADFTDYPINTEPGPECSHRLSDRLALAAS